MLPLPFIEAVPIDPNAVVTCEIFARADLNPNAPAGGTWVYGGYSTNSGGPFNMTPATPLFPGLVAGDVIMQGDDFPIQYKNKTAGFYQLTYNYPGNSNVIILQILSNAICTGEEGSDTVSITSNTPINLLTYLSDVNCPSPDNSGTWEDLDGAGAAFVSGVLTPSLLPLAGTYRFKYMLQESSFVLVSCNTCPAFEGEVSITAIAAFTVTIGSANTTCNYTLDLLHPGTLVANDVEVVMDTGVSRDFPVAKFKARVTNDCGFATVTSATKTFSPSHVMYTGIKNGGGDPQFVAGGFVETVRIYSVDTGNIDIPCAPSGVNQAVFIGSAGTTNATDLTFPVSLSSTVFVGALNIAIKNYLIDVMGLTDTVDFQYGFATVGSPPSQRWLTVYMGVYHSAPNNWAGIKRGTSRIQYRHDGVTLTNSTTYSSLVSTFSVDDEYVASPCLTGGNKLTYLSNSVLLNTFVDLVTIDYNLVPLTASTITISAGAGSNTTEACSAKTLTATPINCLGSVSYSWSPSGAVTSSITALVGSGTHTVVANCTSPVTADSDSITI